MKLLLEQNLTNVPFRARYYTLIVGYTHGWAVLKYTCVYPCICKYFDFYVLKYTKWCNVNTLAALLKFCQ